MNPPLHIDFVAPRPAAGMAGAAFFLLAALAGAAALLKYQNLAATVAGLAQQSEAARHRMERLPRPLAATALSPHAVAATNRAIAQLNLPWQELFAIVEATAHPNVALLSLEPDSRQGRLRIAAEARDPDDMAKLLETLLAEPRLSEVALISHEFNPQDPNRPIRFVLEARWRKEP